MTRVRHSHVELARRIVETIRLQGCARGHHLTEQGLADALGVSRSPVRRALALLADAGLLHYVPKQGYFLARDGDALEMADPALPRTGEEALYMRIANDRFADRLSGSVTVADLLRRYDVSRSLMMKVLTAMAGEGLVERAGGQRWHFLPTLNDPDAYEESYRFRLLVEPAALLSPSFMLDPALLRHLRRSHRRLVEGAVYRIGMGELFEIDARFHLALGEASGNRFLAQAIGHQTRLRRLSEYQFSEDRARLRTSALEHLAILDAIEQGDMTLAARHMREHIRVSCELRPEFTAGPENDML